MTNVFFSDKYCASCNKRYANGVKVSAGAIFSPDSSDLPMLPYTVCKKCHKMATSASAAKRQLVTEAVERKYFALLKIHATH
jgi:hypothetical protein